ncbi:MAG: ribbon-helix-helix domain-containing protein [Proteobacteria bacterium]|nr:ribbon-helix-helix domain-containing protein [Pseudomonadota bacterium]
MKTIQMTLDEDLLKSVDKAVKKLKTSRSAFTRDALWHALNRLNTTLLEKKHINGYKRHPVSEDEFAIWEQEQDWGGE